MDILASMLRPRMALPQYSMTCPVPPALAVNLNPHVLAPPRQESLGSEDMLDFAGADTKGKSTESAVGAGVRVTAHHGRCWQSETLLRPNDVHNTLSLIAHAKVFLSRGGGDVVIGGCKEEDGAIVLLVDDVVFEDLVRLNTVPGEEGSGGTVVVGQSRPSSEVGEMSVVSILEFDLSGRGDIGKDSRARAHVESRAYDGVYHSPSELT
ncbi:hypothetical protein KC354_g41 [Hortaea werneckii]|nr:hypothetical protein KC354_g41 [Hortaea werneckii]